MRPLISIVITVLFLSPMLSIGQTYNLKKSNSSVVVEGTSSLHDWEETAEDFSGSIEFSDLETAAISKLSVSIVAESLKSGKGAMDSNTYKALNTKKYKNITFVLNRVVSSKKLKDGTFQVTSEGNLTLSGVTKKITLEFTLTQLTSGVNLNGEKSFNMTDFGVEPPTAVFGTIKTGDTVTIKFNTTFN